MHLPTVEDVAVAIQKFPRSEMSPDRGGLMSGLYVSRENLTARNWVSFFRRQPRPFCGNDFKSATKADAGSRTSLVRPPVER
jgi:hypothetical protein